jgi:hypothetical protein
MKNIGIKNLYLRKKKTKNVVNLLCSDIEDIIYI